MTPETFIDEMRKAIDSQIRFLDEEGIEDSRKEMLQGLMMNCEYFQDGAYGAIEFESFYTKPQNLS